MAALIVALSRVTCMKWW